MRTAEIEKLCEGRRVLDVGCGRANRFSYPLPDAAFARASGSTCG
jgi:hypothetical protein